MAYVHFIGICGVTMAPLAVLYKNMGWKVSGSDKAFFPPMSTYLAQNGIPIMPGFKAEHLQSRPDFVLATAFITDKNPEVMEARRLGIPVKVYADVLSELIEKENSIVVAGDCGKTSTSALIAWILEKAGYSPNFMIGGIARNFEHGIRKTDSSWSVMEGDEYPASSWDNTPRFLFYNPKYLVLTDVHWDHMDKFKTQRKYIGIFEELAGKMPENGVIFANKDGENIKRVVQNTRARVVFYRMNDSRIFHMPFKGKIWRQNSLAAIALAKHIGIPNSIIHEALKTFLGLKRRQEVRFRKRGLVVIDDNAHTPIKVSGGLEAISKMFPKYDLCVVYEPGNRSSLALQSNDYMCCFKLAKKIILPRISTLSEEVRDFNKKLAKKLASYHADCCYIDDDREVVLQIKNFFQKCRQRKKGTAIVFMSQKGFRGMIEETISLLR